MLLKPNMVISGKECTKHATVEDAIQISSKKYDYLTRVQPINKFVEARLSKDEAYVVYDVFVVR
jgi:hypothetical protein